MQTYQQRQTSIQGGKQYPIPSNITEEIVQNVIGKKPNQFHFYMNGEKCAEDFLGIPQQPQFTYNK